MNKFSVSIVVTLSAFLLLSVGIANAVDLESAKEQPCFEITKKAEVDPNWEGYAVKSWYYPLMSRLDLYLTSLEVAGKDISEVQENELYYDGCVHFEMPGDTVEIVGFGGRRSPMNVTMFNETDPLSPCRFTTQSGRSGTVYSTLTDNTTFIFSVACTDDNQMTWGVSSMLKTLPVETVKLIHDHAESLGFKKEFFTGMRYDNCQID